jgi:hypothetical protein
VLIDAVNETRNEIESPRIKAAIKSVVPTFVDPEEINRNAEKSEEMQMTSV